MADRSPNPQDVNDLHQYDDLDRDVDAHHHTLGRSSSQAAKGDHVHDGSSASTGAYSVIEHNGSPFPSTSILNFEDGLATNDGTTQVVNVLNNSTRVIVHAHDNSDVDLSVNALHHTLGLGSKQSAAGNHTHPVPVPMVQTPSQAPVGLLELVVDELETLFWMGRV